MEFLNIIYLAHIGFRLSSYMLVSFFILMSLFNSDVRGLVFLALLLVETLILVSIGRALDPIFPSDTPSGICNTMNLTVTERLSGPIPLNLNTFAFTFGYLIYIIAKNKLEETPNGVMIMIFFIAIIVAHVIWLFSYNCTNPIMLFFTTVAGTGFGVLFSFMISSSGDNNLQFFGQLTGTEVCKRPTNEKFKCTTKYSM